MLKLITMFCAFFFFYFFLPFNALEWNLEQEKLPLFCTTSGCGLLSPHVTGLIKAGSIAYVSGSATVTDSPSGAMAERVYRDVLGRRGQPSEGSGNRLLNTRTRRVRDGVQKMIQDSWENLDSAKHGFSCHWLQGWLSLIGRPSRPIILVMADTLVFMEATHAHRIQHMLIFFAGFWMSSQ